MASRTREPSTAATDGTAPATQLPDLTRTDYARIYAAVDRAWAEDVTAGETDDHPAVLDVLNAASVLYGDDALLAIFTGRSPRANEPTEQR